MKISTLVGTSTWIGILTIIFGVLLGAFDNNFTTWFCFAFLCFIGLMAWSQAWQKK